MTKGDKVTVSGGKYDGKTGIVTSVAAQSCRLQISDGVTTGNIRNELLRVNND
jgi:ribosomal protein L24